MLCEEDYTQYPTISIINKNNKMNLNNFPPQFIVKSSHSLSDVATIVRKKYFFFFNIY